MLPSFGRSISRASPKSRIVADLHHPWSLADHDVRRLDVPMDQSAAMRFDERAGDHLEDASHAGGRLGACALDEELQRRPVEQLHRVIEDSVGRVAVVVDRDRIRVLELGGDLDLALEALDGLLSDLVARQEFHRGRAPEQRVTRAVDDPHSALADLAFERVLPEPPRLLHVLVEAVDDRREHGADGDGDGP
jgi:hypothetical protein